MPSRSLKKTQLTSNDKSNSRKNLLTREELMEYEIYAGLIKLLS